MLPIKEIIDGFKALDLATEPTDAIRTLIKQVGPVGYMMVTFHKGKAILRARPSELDRFTKKEELSFKPQHLNTTYQRASIPQKTMFYGCVLPDDSKLDDFANWRITGALEAMPWLRDKTTSGHRKISYGGWFVKEDINLVAIVHENSHFEQNSYSKELVEAYDHFIAQEDKEIMNRSLKFQTFLADEFSKEININFDYLISAIFTNIVVSNPNLNIDGVIYPSLRVIGKGLNVAITVEASSRLGLYVAGECSLYKLKDHTVGGNDALIELDGQTDQFVMADLESDREICLQQLGVVSVDDLK